MPEHQKSLQRAWGWSRTGSPQNLVPGVKGSPSTVLLPKRETEAQSKKETPPKSPAVQLNTQSMSTELPALVHG